MAVKGFFSNFEAALLFSALRKSLLEFVKLDSIRNVGESGISQLLLGSQLREFSLNLS